MNFRQHVRVTPSMHVEISVDDHPELARVIRIPRDAPSHWATEAYLLSLGLEAERDRYDDADLEPHLHLGQWQPRVQRLRVAEIEHPIDAIISGPYANAVGDARVSIVESESARTHEGAPASAIDWQTAPPPFRREHVNLELARRFGVVMPHFDASGLADLDRGIRDSSAIASLASSLSTVRRLALRAHLEQSGVLDESSADESDRQSATEALRLLFSALPAEGVEQPAGGGWLPDALLTDIISALRWPDAAADGLPDPAEALVALARRTRSIRRLRGRIVVTNRGRALAAGDAAPFSDVVDSVRKTGRPGRYGGQQPLDVTLALLAIADESAATFAELPELVRLGQAATASGPDHYEEYGDWFPRPHLGAGIDARDSAVLPQLVEALAALSAPKAYGTITPAMRTVARLALL